MLLPQTALVPLLTPVEGLYISSRNKITKGGMRRPFVKGFQVKIFDVL